MKIAELKIIIENLKSGRWSLPLSSLLLSESFGEASGSYWKQVFKGFQDNHFTTEQAIFALTEIKNGLTGYSATNPASFELVWTGPEALNSTFRDSSIVAQDLFRQAKNEVLVATYVVYQGKEIFKELGQKVDSDPNFKVTFVIDVQRNGNTSVEEAVLLKFKTDFTKQWPAKRLPDIYYYTRSLEQGNNEKYSMHAKCIVVDSEKSLITSANFTQAAHHRNIEAGVVIHSNEYAINLKSQFFNLIEAGVLKKI